MKIFQYLLGLQLLALVLSTHLPKYIPTCYRNDENLENCLLNITESLKPHLKDGFPEFHIPSLEPLVLPRLDVIQKTKDFGFKVHLENFTVAGMSNYKFQKFRFDPKTLTFTGTVATGPILFTMFLRAKGVVVVVPLDTEARLVAPMGPFLTNFTIKGTTKTRNHKTYYKPTEIKMNMSIEHCQIESVDVEGMPNLAHSSIVTMFNENSKIILPQITPVIKEFFEQVAMKYFPLVTNAVPFDNLLPIR